MRSPIRRPTVRIQAPFPILRGLIGLAIAYVLIRSCVAHAEVNMASDAGAAQQVETDPGVAARQRLLDQDGSA